MKGGATPAALPLLQLVEDYRVRCDLSHKMLYDLLGVTQAAYLHWRTGLRKPSRRNMLAIKKLGAAMKQAYMREELPLRVEEPMSVLARKATIRSILETYLGIAPSVPEAQDE